MPHINRFDTSTKPIATDDDPTNSVTVAGGAQAGTACETNDPLSLARFCAQRLNLQIQLDTEVRDRLQFRVSNIRCV